MPAHAPDGLWSAVTRRIVTERGADGWVVRPNSDPIEPNDPADIALAHRTEDMHVLAEIAADTPETGCGVLGFRGPKGLWDAMVGTTGEGPRELPSRSVDELSVVGSMFDYDPGLARPVDPAEIDPAP